MSPVVKRKGERFTLPSKYLLFILTLLCMALIVLTFNTNFMDIQMPGMDGMETAKVLRQDNENMILIFVTAAEEYVFQAYG